ncbi:hypothetical protein BDZ90DRAFT_274988 [Jaminaea rosea]|uniref:Uncharacterized protein n=1 Tax=Jaminaea rosea TaxID=1569628 RepID=A0A316UPJ3_9BASI|nr:hypothetical protein BDZ90DRAFT_274988 [Jaminaea rosea]PWN27222.1 hypothetical protein BDZ90DRAFT_274988 [Jaminaea rosea]
MAPTSADSKASSKALSSSTSKADESRGSRSTHTKVVSFKIAPNEVPATTSAQSSHAQRPHQADVAAQPAHKASSDKLSAQTADAAASAKASTSAKASEQTTSSPSKSSAESPITPHGPKGSRVEINADANAVVINTACEKCIEENVRCVVDSKGYRHGAQRRHFESPLSPWPDGDCLEGIHDMLLWYKEWSCLPDDFPELDLEPRGDDTWLDAEDIEDVPARALADMLKWRVWQKHCPYPQGVPDFHFRNDWLNKILAGEEKQQDETQKRVDQDRSGSTEKLSATTSTSLSTEDAFVASPRQPTLLTRVVKTVEKTIDAGSAAAHKEIEVTETTATVPLSPRKVKGLVDASMDRLPKKRRVQ